MGRPLLRTALAGMAVATALAGAAFGGSTPNRSTGAGDLNGFGGPVKTHSFAVKPLYHERTVATSYRLHAVPCASAAAGDRSSVCYAAR
jgi:hypothetical protein